MLHSIMDDQNTLNTLEQPLAQDIQQAFPHSFHSLIISPLSGGNSGTSIYKIKDHTQSYVLKKISRDERTQMIQISQQTSNIGVAPKLFFPHDESQLSYCIINQFIDGNNVMFARLLPFQSKICNSLRKLHCLPTANLRKAKTLYQMSQELTKRLNTTHDLAPYLEQAKEIDIELNRLPYDSKFIHGDFHVGNVMIDNHTNEAIFIDWDDSGIGDPLSDIATLSVTAVLTKEKTDDLLCEYFQDFRNEQTLYRFTLLKKLAWLNLAASIFLQLQKNNWCYSKPKILPSFNEFHNNVTSANFSLNSEHELNILIEIALQSFDEMTVCKSLAPRTKRP